jgi:hypothetical protein
VKERWVGIDEGGEFVGAAAKDREDAGNVVASLGSRGQEDLDAGGEALRVAGVSLDDVVEGGAGIFRVTAVRIGAVIEKPLKRFRFEILARRKENGEPAPAESVDVGTVTNQEFHHRNAAGLRDAHERHVFDQNLTKFGVGGQEFLDVREVVGVDRLFELATHVERLYVQLELGPAWKAVPSGDLKLCIGKCGGGAERRRSLAWSRRWRRLGRSGNGMSESLSCAGVRINRAKGHSLMATDYRMGFYPFRGPDASLTLVSG